MPTACPGSSATWSPPSAARARSPPGIRRRLLPAELRRGGNAIESLQRENRIRQLVGAAVQHRAGQRQELLRHRLCIRERIRLAGGIGIEPLVHAVVGDNADARAEDRKSTRLNSSHDQNSYAVFCLKKKKKKTKIKKKKRKKKKKKNKK